MEEGLTLCRTVNVSRFHQAVVNSRNTRHIEHHCRSDINPKSNNTDYPHRQRNGPFHRHQPVGALDPENRQQLIQAHIGLQQEAEEKAQRSRRKNTGQINDILVKILSPSQIRQDHGQQQAHGLLGDQ